MLYSPHGRPGKLFGLALVCLLVASALPASPRPAAAGRAQDATAVPNIPPGSAYRQTNLVSDAAALALRQNPLLVNPWGLAFGRNVPFYVANHGTGTAIPFGNVDQTVTIPGGLPTGAVANQSGSFPITFNSGTRPSRFLYATLDGDIMGWTHFAPVPLTSAVVRSRNPGSVYTGLAINSRLGGDKLYAADFANGRVDVFDAAFRKTTVPGGFADPTVPAGYHPFNVQTYAGAVYVTYAKVGPGRAPEEGPGKGFVRRFDTDGVRDPGFAVNGGRLNAPWGVAVAPNVLHHFGVFDQSLIVGNFGAGGPSLNAYDPTTGAFRGSLKDEAGADIRIDNLRALFMPDTDPRRTQLYFTAGAGEGEHGIFGVIAPTAATAASLLRFSAAGYSVGEGGGHVDVTVVREGSTSEAAAVNYLTLSESRPGRASQKSDYGLALGRLAFAPGEARKTFRVLVVNDRFVEGGEALTLVLSNPSGAGVGLGSPATASLLIADNDTAPPASNPIDEARFFVRQHYLDFLNREPGAAGLDFWANQIASCGADAGCAAVAREHVSAAFFLSIEFQETGLLAYLAHRAAFGTRPLYDRFMLGTQALQRGVAFGAPGAAARLEANKQQFFADFVSTPEFADRLPSNLTPADYADALFAGAGVRPTAAQRQAVIAEFGGASDTADAAARARGLRRVAENAAFKQQEFTSAFVLMEYFGYLRRDPGEGGFNFWLGKLNANGGDFHRAEMVKAFIVSIEYRQRFGP